MRSHISEKLNKWLTGLVMICLLAGIVMIPRGIAYAASYGDPVDVVVPYTHIYDAEGNRRNDTFTYQITPVDGAPAPQGSSNGVYYFEVEAVPESVAQTDQVDLKIAFPSPGEYNYTVAAVDENQDGVTYESRTYTINVYVQNASNGGLKAPLVTALGSNGRKYARLQLNPAHAAEQLPVRPITTPDGDGTLPVINDDGTIEDIQNEPTPLQDIIDKVVPKADPDRDYWSLINLLCAIATVITAIVLVFRFFERIDTEDDEYIIRREGWLRMLTIIPGLASVITFLATEDLSLPMGLTDEWTWLMGVFVLVDLALLLGVYFKYDRNNGDDGSGGDTDSVSNRQMKESLA